MTVQVRLNTISPYRSQQLSPAIQDIISGRTKTETYYALCKSHSGTNDSSCSVHCYYMAWKEVADILEC